VGGRSSGRGGDNVIGERGRWMTSQKITSLGEEDYVTGRGGK